MRVSLRIVVNELGGLLSCRKKDTLSTTYRVWSIERLRGHERPRLLLRRHRCTPAMAGRKLDLRGVSAEVDLTSTRIYQYRAW